MIKGSEEAQSKRVDSNPDAGAFLYLYPCVTPVKIITLRDLESFNFHRIDRFDNCMNSELVVKELIKLAISTAIVIVTRPEFNTSLHMVNA